MSQVGLTAVAFMALTAHAHALTPPIPEAAFPARAGKSRVVFECNRINKETAVWLRLTDPPGGWRAHRPATIRIGARSFKVEIDGASGSSVLSDVPLPKMGVTRALLAAVRAGDELVLSGPAAERIPARRRSFPLDGTEKAKLQRVEQACFPGSP